jgi:hypothetical protein
MLVAVERVSPRLLHTQRRSHRARQGVLSASRGLRQAEGLSEVPAVVACWLRR